MVGPGNEKGGPRGPKVGLWGAKVGPEGAKVEGCRGRSGEPTFVFGKSVLGALKVERLVLGPTMPVENKQMS